MDITSLTEGIKSALRANNILDTREEETGTDFHFLLGKLKHSDEFHVREFLFALLDILVFGGFFNRKEGEIQDFEHLDYRKTKEKVHTFINEVLTRCEYLPVDPILLYELALQLINGEITPAHAVPLGRIFSGELKDVSPKLLNYQEDLLNGRMGRILEILEMYLSLIPQLELLDERMIFREHQERWVFKQLMQDGYWPEEREFIRNVNHFLRKVGRVMRWSKTDTYVLLDSLIENPVQWLSHEEYRNLGDWLGLFQDVECEQKEYLGRIVEKISERTGGALVKVSPEEHQVARSFTEQWFFIASYYPWILDQDPGNFLILLESLLSHEIPDPSRIGSMDRVITRNYNPRKFRTDLLEHLFVMHETPHWFLTYFFEGSELERSCFFHLAAGNNLRYMKTFPFPITRREAHKMATLAPSMVPINHCGNWTELGLFYAKLLVNGCPDRLVESLNRHSWQVNRILVSNERLEDLAHFIITNRAEWNVNGGQGQILDYIHFKIQEDEYFFVSDRSFQSIHRLSLRWHKQAGGRWAGSRFLPSVWRPVMIGDFSLSRKDCTYHIRQITSLGRLYEEGHELSHCVSSYASSCISGNTAIFSLCRENVEGQQKKLVTLQVSNRVIIQARGKCNRSMNQLERSIVREWALDQHLRTAV